MEALRGYRNGDGGFGHALEPDLRSPGSQPAPTLHALEILNEAGAADGELARAGRAWIAQIAAPDGGIPSALPGFEEYPHAPWWTARSPDSMLTLALAAASHAGGVSDDEWLDRATEWCWRSIEEHEQPGGYWLKYACAFLDAVARRAPRSCRDRVARHPRDMSAIAPVGRRRGRGAAPARPLAASGQPVTSPVQRGPDRSSPRRRRVRAAGRRRLDVRLAGLVAGADDRLAWQRHDSRVDLAA